MTKTIEQLYEELRAVIDGGSESMTHEGAIEEVKALKEQHELREPIAYAIYDIKRGGSRSLVWADQYTPEGDPTQFRAVPLAHTRRRPDSISCRAFGTHRIIVDVYGGCVTSIYGDRLPAGVEIECIVRDYDSIEEGGPDPVDKNYVPEVYYW